MDYAETTSDDPAPPPSPPPVYDDPIIAVDAARHSSSDASHRNENPLRPDASPLSPYRARAEEAFRREDADLERAAASMDRGSEIAEHKSAALAPLRHQMAEEYARPMPQVPGMTPAPKVPHRTAEDNKNAENWLFAASLLGSLAGAFTRNHVTVALGAFQGAMEGYAQGNRQKFDQDMKTWEAENKRIQEDNKNRLDRYREILENRKLSRDQMSVHLQLAAMEFDDQAMATAARSKNDITMAQLHDKQAEAALRMQNSVDTFQLKQAELERKERADLLKAQMRATGFGTSPDQMQATIDAIGRGDRAPIRGRAGVAIMEEVSRQYPDYNENTFAEKRYRQLIAAREEAAARTTEARVAAARGANLQMIVRTTSALIPLALESSKAVPRESFIPLNKLIQMYETNVISDPKLKKLAFDSLNVAESWGRAMGGTGHLRESDREIARAMISTADSPETYEEVLRALDMMLVREMKAISDEREHRPMPPGPFTPREPAPGTAPAGGAPPVDDPWGVR
jgi:hypothetical protein